MNTSEFEVWLRYLVEELSTLSNTAHSMIGGPDAELRSKILDMQWRIDSLRRFYDFTLAEVRSGNPGTAAALRAGEAAHLEREVSFIESELQRGREAVADSRRSLLEGQTNTARLERDGAVRAHGEAERRIDEAEERGWNTNDLRNELDNLTLEIADLPPQTP